MAYAVFLLKVSCPKNVTLFWGAPVAHQINACWLRLGFESGLGSLLNTFPLCLSLPFLSHFT